MRKRFFEVLLLCIACIVNAQTTNEKKLSWDFPVKPGMEEWKRMSYQEAVIALQIPEDILSSLSTEDLTEICLRYPFLFEIKIYKTFEMGLDTLFKRFNGVRELFNRDDVSKELLKQYQNKMQNLSYLCGDDSLLKKGIFIVSIAYIEMLLSRYQVKDESKKDDFLEILHDIVIGYEKKLKYPEYMDSFTLGVNLYARLHMIIKIDEQNIKKIPKQDRNGVFINGIADEQTIQAVDELSYQLINKIR